ncbi:hypothetical protein D3C79_997130 [compost metagenome]
MGVLVEMARVIRGALYRLGRPGYVGLRRDGGKLQRAAVGHDFFQGGDGERGPLWSDAAKTGNVAGHVPLACDYRATKVQFDGLID